MECSHKYNLILSDTSGFTKKVYVYRCEFCGDIQIRNSFSPLSLISTLRRDTTSLVKSRQNKNNSYRKAA